MPTESRGSWPRLALLAILTLGLSLRLPGMIGWWINPDEGAYYSMVTWDRWEPFWNEVAGHAHPPFYYVLLRLVGQVTHEFLSLRSVALVSGLAAIGLVSLVGRELAGGGKTGTATGLVAAFILAVSPGAVLISQIIRPYALLVALSLAACLFLLRFRPGNRPGYLVAYSLALSLALLTHYSAVFVLLTLVVLIAVDLPGGGLQRTQLSSLVLAHVVPGMTLVGLYVFHLRPHLMKSGLGTEAFEGWLQRFMIDSVSDVWLNTLGFFSALVGPRFAAPALLAFLLGMALAFWRRSWLLAGTGFTALSIGILAAAAGRYPFGACRHSSWLIGFLIFPLAWVLSLGFTSGRRLAVASSLGILAAGLSGPAVGRALGSYRAVLEPHQEHLIWRADLEAAMEAALAESESELVLISYQTYYVLLPLFETERESRVYYPDGRFYRFRWDGREVFVSKEWKFAVHPDHLSEADHLFNVIRSVDRNVPEIGLKDRHGVLMIFAGWLESAPIALERANSVLPPEEPLARLLASAERISILDVDMWRFWNWFEEYVEAQSGET